jgi:hypothetical protein
VTLGDPRIRGALAGVLVNGMFAAPVVPFASVLVRQSFGASAGLFSVALAAFGAGGLAGATMLLALDPAGDNRRTGSRFATAFGVFVVAIALAPRGWLLPVIAVCGGCAMTASNTLANTVVQATIGSRGRGKAASVYMLAL